MPVSGSDEGDQSVMPRIDSTSVVHDNACHLHGAVYERRFDQQLSHSTLSGRQHAAVRTECVPDGSESLYAERDSLSFWPDEFHAALRCGPDADGSESLFL